MLKWLVMDRREFVKHVGLGLAAGWAVGRLAWPFTARAADPEVRLALLADAHLKDGNDRRPEAVALARAVAEIGKLSPPPELVLFSGDLAHRGRPDALDLGREILAGLPAPVLAVCGEGDHGPRGNAAWVRRWGNALVLPVDAGVPSPGIGHLPHPRSWRAGLAIGPVQRRWLARELSRLSPATPLVILSPRSPGPPLSTPGSTGPATPREWPGCSRHSPMCSICTGMYMGWGSGVRDQGSAEKSPLLSPL